MGGIQWPTGEVRWGYHLAATLRDLRITIPRTRTGARTLRASLVTANAFQLTQPGLTLVVPFGKGGWPITAITVTAGTVTASLGPPEE